MKIQVWFPLRLHGQVLAMLACLISMGLLLRRRDQVPVTWAPNFAECWETNSVFTYYVHITFGMLFHAEPSAMIIDLIRRISKLEIWLVMYRCKIQGFADSCWKSLVDLYPYQCAGPERNTQWNPAQFVALRLKSPSDCQRASAFGGLCT